MASLLLLSYTYYRSEITFQGVKNAIYFKYYLISLVGILFSGIVLRLRERIRANVVTVVTLLVVGLYLTEGGLILLGHKVGPQSYRAAAAAELGIEYDERTKLEVFDDLNEDGVDAVPVVSPIDLYLEHMNEKLLPLGGISKKITVGNNENGNRMIFQTDRYGFNNPDSEWGATKVEWLLTGDSFAEGQAVQAGEDIAGQLRVITKKSAINLGKSGNGPLIELGELKEYAEAIKPKRVLWTYYEGNDLVFDLPIEKKSPLLMQYMQDGFSQNLINRQKEIDSWLQEIIVKAKQQARAQEQERQLQGRQHKAGWMRLQVIRDRIGFDYYEYGYSYLDVDRLFTDILTKAKARVEEWGGKLYFVYLPDHFRYKRVTSHDRYRKKSKVIDVVKGLDIPVIDIHQEVFADHHDPLALFPFHLQGHYTADGYNEVAKAIVENIMGEAEYSPAVKLSR